MNNNVLAFSVYGPGGHINQKWDFPAQPNTTSRSHNHQPIHKMSSPIPTTAPLKPWYKNTSLGPMVLGEAPLFRASDNTLHWVDPLKDPSELHILHLDPESGAPNGEAKTFVLEDSVSVMCFRQGKKGYICAYYQGIAFLDEETGKLEVVKEIIPSADREDMRFNDGEFS